MYVCMYVYVCMYIVQRVRDCVRNGNYHTLDPASKHSFALQLWTRALLRVVLKGDRLSTNPARR